MPGQGGTTDVSNNARFPAPRSRGHPGDARGHRRAEDCRPRGADGLFPANGRGSRLWRRHDHARRWARVLGGEGAPVTGVMTAGKGRATGLWPPAGRGERCCQWHGRHTLLGGVRRGPMWLTQCRHAARPRRRVRAPKPGGEVDIRGCYCAVAVCHMLGLDPEPLVQRCGMVDFIQRCQVSWAGGFGQGLEGRRGTTAPWPPPTRIRPWA